MVLWHYVKDTFITLSNISMPLFSDIMSHFNYSSAYLKCFLHKELHY